LQYSDSNNIYCRGVYYIQNIGDYLGKNALATSFGDGDPNSVEFGAYVFCTADPSNPGGASDDNHDTRYDVSLTLTTGTAPSWSNP